jgi:glycosyltransferase involved in cell wall biosynthesis
MEAILSVPRAAFVLLGYGALREKLEGSVAEPRYQGRVCLLDPVPPSDLLRWTVSADVMLMAIQPTTLNHRFTTPNKLWEAIGAGVPVVASDLPGMSLVVREAGCGVLCDPTDPLDIARAIRAIVDAPSDEQERLRANALAAAHDRYNWETQAGGLLELYRRLLT